MWANVTANWLRCFVLWNSDIMYEMGSNKRKPDLVPSAHYTAESALDNLSPLFSYCLFDFTAHLKCLCEGGGVCVVCIYKPKGDKSIADCTRYHPDDTANSSLPHHDSWVHEGLWKKKEEERNVSDEWLPERGRGLLWLTVSQSPQQPSYLLSAAEGELYE